jgi:hypothetical protein
LRLRKRFKINEFEYLWNVSRHEFHLQLVRTVARFDIGQTDLTTTAHYSVAKQVLDAAALEVAGAQEVPEMITI